MSEQAAVETKVQEKYSGLLVSGNGKPYATEQDLRDAMAKKKINAYNVVSVDGGFAGHAEKYWRVRFQAKSNPNDTDDVMLSVNGETLIIAREKVVVIPDRYKECADHATYPHFRQMPNKPRKIIGRIRVYPYDLLGEATEKEFLEQKTAGTRMTKAMIKKHGFDVDPDTLPENQVDQE